MDTIFVLAKSPKVTTLEKKIEISTKIFKLKVKCTVAVP